MPRPTAEPQDARAVTVRAALMDSAPSFFRKPGGLPTALADKVTAAVLGALDASLEELGGHERMPDQEVYAVETPHLVGVERLPVVPDDLPNAVRAELEWLHAHPGEANCSAHPAAASRYLAVCRAPVGWVENDRGGFVWAGTAVVTDRTRAWSVCEDCAGLLDARDDARVTDTGPDELGHVCRPYVAQLGPPPPAGPPACPECRAGKHPNCDGRTWDTAADAHVPCPCSEKDHAGA